MKTKNRKGTVDYTKDQLKAYVVEPIDDDWSMVNQTEYFTSGRWVIGMNLITSLGDVMQRAYENKVAIFPITIFEPDRLKGK